MHLQHSQVRGGTEAFKCCGQRFATSTAQSCATLPVHELPATRDEDAKPRRTRLQCQSLPATSRNWANPPSRFFSRPCTEYFLLLLQAYVITYFATSSSTKSPARIALILGRGNYLLEMTKFGASTLCAALTVLTARMGSCAAALLSRKPRVVIEN